MLRFPFLLIVHALNQWSTDKMMALMKNYRWGNTNKATQSAPLACPPCPKYDPGKPCCTAPGYLEMPSGPCKVWQIDFILPPSHGYKCFSHGMYVFSLDQSFPL